MIAPDAPNTSFPRPPEIDAAVEAVSRAAAVCQAIQSGLVGPETLTKPDRSPVTVADFAAQAIVCATLTERIAATEPLEIVGEERAAELRKADQAEIRRQVVSHVAAGMARRVDEEQALDWIDAGAADATADAFWTLDPVDGTKGFLRGGQYAVALARIDRGQVELAVLACPNLTLPYGARLDEGSDASHGSDSGRRPPVRGVMLVAVRGGGAWLRPLAGGPPQRLQVADTRNPGDARLCESFEPSHARHDWSADIARQLGITAEPYRIDSQCKYAAVAAGDASIYLRRTQQAGYREKIWDHAAGMLCVEEAGGKVTDADGNKLDFSTGRLLAPNNGIVATNGWLHDAVLAAVAKGQSTRVA